MFTSVFVLIMVCVGGGTGWWCRDRQCATANKRLEVECLDVTYEHCIETTDSLYFNESPEVAVGALLSFVGILTPFVEAGFVEGEHATPYKVSLALAHGRLAKIFLQFHLEDRARLHIAEAIRCYGGLQAHDGWHPPTIANADQVLQAVLDADDAGDPINWKM